MATRSPTTITSQSSATSTSNSPCRVQFQHPELVCERVGGRDPRHDPQLHPQRLERGGEAGFDAVDEVDDDRGVRQGARKASDREREAFGHRRKRRPVLGHAGEEDARGLIAHRRRRTGPDGSATRCSPSRSPWTRSRESCRRRPRACDCRAAARTPRPRSRRSLPSCTASCAGRSAGSWTRTAAGRRP